MRIDMLFSNLVTASFSTPCCRCLAVAKSDRECSLVHVDVASAWNMQLARPSLISHSVKAATESIAIDSSRLASNHDDSTSYHCELDTQLTHGTTTTTSHFQTNNSEQVIAPSATQTESTTINRHSSPTEMFAAQFFDNFMRHDPYVSHTYTCTHRITSHAAVSIWSLPECLHLCVHRDSLVSTPAAAPVLPVQIPSLLTLLTVGLRFRSILQWQSTNNHTTTTPLQQ
jgi:hypothetical protein